MFLTPWLIGITVVTLPRGGVCKDMDKSMKTFDVASGEKAKCYAFKQQDHYGECLSIFFKSTLTAPDHFNV